MIIHKIFLRVLFVLLAIIAFMLVSFSPVVPAIPPNDDFNNATVISGLPFTDYLDTSDATTAADDPSRPALSVK